MTVCCRVVVPSLRLAAFTWCSIVRLDTPSMLEMLSVDWPSAGPANLSFGEAELVCCSHMPAQALRFGMTSMTRICRADRV